MSILGCGLDLYSVKLPDVFCFFSPPSGDWVSLTSKYNKEQNRMKEKMRGGGKEKERGGKGRDWKGWGGKL